MSCFDPGQSCGGGMEGLAAQHWPRDPLNKTKILLEDIVEVFDLQNLDDPPCAAGLSRLEI